jgi:hypothetical protein
VLSEYRCDDAVQEGESFAEDENEGVFLVDCDDSFLSFEGVDYVSVLGQHRAEDIYSKLNLIEQAYLKVRKMIGDSGNYFRVHCFAPLPRSKFVLFVGLLLLVCLFEIPFKSC